MKIKASCTLLDHTFLDTLCIHCAVLAKAGFAFAATGQYDPKTAFLNFGDVWKVYWQTLDVKKRA